MKIEQMTFKLHNSILTRLVSEKLEISIPATEVIWYEDLHRWCWAASVFVGFDYRFKFHELSEDNVFNNLIKVLD